MKPHERDVPKLERCPWVGIDDPLYARYHDEEWGVPHADERRLFEKLLLEGFQAGLSWITILRKREAFRRAFHDFDPERMARYTDRDVARLMAIQHDIHLSFIDLVKTSRGARLKGPESALFSGEYWAGRKALEYGLVDGLGDLRSVLRQRFGEEVRLPVMAERGWLARRISGTRQFPAGLGDEILSALEARALWARYGL